MGFWFSLGHSTIVFALALLISLGVTRARRLGTNDSSRLHDVTGSIGTTVSGTFLYLIAAINVVILFGIIKVFREMRTGRYDEAELERAARQPRADEPVLRAASPRRSPSRGRCTRSGCCSASGSTPPPRSRCWSSPAAPAAAGLPWYAILCLPVLFAAGMSLMDTIDGSFMNFAYGWAFSKPVRKVFYNLTITGLSVAVALVIGTIELGGLVAERSNLTGRVLGLVRGHRPQRARLHHRRRCSWPRG